MLVLANRNIHFSELKIVQNCHHLIKLDLSSNKIKNFPPNINFTRLYSLKLLYLHNNYIEDLDQIELFFKNRLRYLTIFSNPVSNLPGVI